MAQWERSTNPTTRAPAPGAHGGRRANCHTSFSALHTPAVEVHTRYKHLKFTSLYVCVYHMVQVPTTARGRRAKSALELQARHQLPRVLRTQLRPLNHLQASNNFKHRQKLTNNSPHECKLTESDPPQSWKTEGIIT